MLIIAATYTMEELNNDDRSIWIFVRIIAICVFVISFTMYRFAYESTQRMLAMGIEASRKNKNKGRTATAAGYTKAASNGNELLSKKSSSIHSSNKPSSDKKRSLIEMEEIKECMELVSIPTVLLPRIDLNSQ